MGNFQVAEYLKTKEIIFSHYFHSQVSKKESFVLQGRCDVNMPARLARIRYTKQSPQTIPIPESSPRPKQPQTTNPKQEHQLQPYENIIPSQFIHQNPQFRRNTTSSCSSVAQPAFPAASELTLPDSPLDSPAGLLKRSGGAEAEARDEVRGGSVGARLCLRCLQQGRGTGAGPGRWPSEGQWT